MGLKVALVAEPSEAHLALKLRFHAALVLYMAH